MPRTITLTEPTAVLALEAVSDRLAEIRKAMARAEKNNRKPARHMRRDEILHELAQREIATELVPVKGATAERMPRHDAMYATADESPRYSGPSAESKALGARLGDDEKPLHEGES